MNKEYNGRVSSKNSERWLKNLQNTTGDYFFLPHPVYVNTVMLQFEAVCYDGFYATVACDI